LPFFLINKELLQPSCPMTDEWIKKMCTIYKKTEPTKKRKCGIYTQQSFIQLLRMKLLFAGKLMELENFMSSKVKLKNSKVTCFLSYVEAKTYEFNVFIETYI
jgi:hypothetical protein